MAPNLMTIAKEIRLRILEFVAEDVTLELAFKTLGNHDIALRLCLMYTISDAEYGAQTIRDTKLARMSSELRQETNFHLACFAKNYTRLSANLRHWTSIHIAD